MPGVHDGFVSEAFEQALRDIGKQLRKSLLILPRVAHPAREEAVTGEEQHRLTIGRCKRNRAGGVAAQRDHLELHSPNSNALATHELPVSGHLPLFEELLGVISPHRHLRAGHSSEHCGGACVIPMGMRRENPPEPRPVSATRFGVSVSVTRVSRIAQAVSNERLQRRHIVCGVDERLVARRLRGEQVDSIVHLRHKNASHRVGRAIVQQLRHHDPSSSTMTPRYSGSPHRVTRSTVLSGSGSAYVSTHDSPLGACTHGSDTMR